MKPKVLCIDDERAIRDLLADVIRQNDHEVYTASNGKDALALISKNNIDIVICDIKMPGLSGIEVLRQITEISPETIVIMITAYASVDTAVAALRYGAFDYILKPLIYEDVLAKISRIVNHLYIKRENQMLRQKIEEQYDFRNIVGKSKLMQEVFNIIRKLSATTSNILITGESGTGKEMIAGAIHYNSPMKDGTFLPINCGAIPTALWESELFGHEQGAFTGAVSKKEGYLQIVKGGTLFLDEISEITIDAQVKLLRVIDNQEFTPVGSVKAQQLKARIVATSNQDLKQMVAQGKFREDLYYRLNVVQIHVPPLREREEDIPLLTRHFIGRYNRELGKKIRGVDNMTMKLLLSYTWRGNVRELKNVIERAMIFCDGEVIGIEDLPIEIQETRKSAGLVGHGNLKQSVREFEKISILSVLAEVSFDKKKAQSILGLSRSSLYRKMEELGIEFSPDPSQPGARLINLSQK
ncbi:MAG: sigma-54 dependent transcriptional regulator [Desulfobacterales bacterium]|nr:sigma-54 dependent transcriptional regulator [Desulfobacterales bacterium]